MSDCRFGVPPVNCPDPEMGLRKYRNGLRRYHWAPERTSGHDEGTSKGSVEWVRTYYICSRLEEAGIA